MISVGQVVNAVTMRGDTPVLVGESLEQYQAPCPKCGAKGDFWKDRETGRARARCRKGCAEAVILAEWENGLPSVAEGETARSEAVKRGGSDPPRQTEARASELTATPRRSLGRPVSTGSPIEKVLGALEARDCGPRRSGANVSARCPAHDDHRASLSVGEGIDGRALVKCHAGCETADVLAALALEEKDLFAETPRRGKKSSASRREVARYIYQGADSAELYHVRRYEPKDFRPYKPGATAPGLDGTPRVLYRLPEVLAAVKEGRLVFVVEGEKDADNLAALGLTATTAAGGAGASWQPDFSETLRGAPVCIIADRDDPGRKHARKVAAALSGVAASVRVVEVTAGKDASDYIAAGAKREDFEKLAGASEWRSEPVPAPSVTVRLADVQPERVTWLWDARIPFGKVTLIDGDPGLGKSTLALEVAARLTTGRAMPEGEAVGPANVVILTAEDGLADTIRPRLDAAGADTSRVFALTAARAENGEETFPTLDLNLDAVADALRKHEARYLIVDPLMAFLGGTVNSWRDQDVRRVLAPLAKLAEGTGVAVVVIRHLTKSGGANAVYRGGGSIGISGAARSVLLVAKDPEDENRRVIASSKSNLSIPPASLAYRVEASGLACRIVFDGTCPLSADGLLAAAEEAQGGEDRSARSDAEDFLRHALSGGSMPVTTLQAEARKAGHNWRTVRRAKENLRVEAKRAGFGASGRWEWELPIGGQPTPKASTPGEWPPMEKVATYGEDPPLGNAPEEERDAHETPVTVVRRILS